ncbi:MAG: Hsp20/alpha crystallin family protein [Deltaproteobacteria bacterium]
MGVPARRDNRRVLESLQDDISQLLGAPLPAFPSVERELFAPSTDVWEDKDNIHVDSDMPGLQPNDISVSVSDDTLTIAAQKEISEESKHKKGRYFRSERYEGSLYRRVTLPASVDPSKVKAKYHEGVLSVTLPKTQKEKEKDKKVTVE